MPWVFRWSYIMCQGVIFLYNDQNGDYTWGVGSHTKLINKTFKGARNTTGDRLYRMEAELINGPGKLNFEGKTANADLKAKFEDKLLDMAGTPAKLVAYVKKHGWDDAFFNIFKDNRASDLVDQEIEKITKSVRLSSRVTYALSDAGYTLSQIAGYDQLNDLTYDIEQSLQRQVVEDLPDPKPPVARLRKKLKDAVLAKLKDVDFTSVGDLQDAADDVRQAIENFADDEVSAYDTDGHAREYDDLINSEQAKVDKIVNEDLATLELAHAKLKGITAVAFEKAVKHTDWLRPAWAAAEKNQAAKTKVYKVGEKIVTGKSAIKKPAKKVAKKTAAKNAAKKPAARRRR
jgi:hypothetical protein